VNESDPELEEVAPTHNLDQVQVDVGVLKARLTPKGTNDMMGYLAQWALMAVGVLFIAYKLFDCGETPPPCENCGSHRTKSEQPPAKEN
jgi:hypothetical protein